MRKTFLLLVLGLTGMVASAQSDAPGDMSFAFQLGTNFPQGALKDDGQTGWTSSFDFTYNMSRAFQARTEIGFSYNHIALPPNLLGVTGSHYNWNVTENAVYNITSGPTTFYVIAGVGGYRTTLTLDDTVVYPGGGWWYGWYYPMYGTATIASKTTTKLGFNAGIGVIFKTGGQASFFIESRFTQIQTHTPIEYVPLTFGVRF